MKLIHLSDLHVTPPGVRHLGYLPRRQLETAIASVNAEHSDASLVVITGDLAALGQSAAYGELKECLQTLSVPYRLCLGNGDHRARFRAAFPDAPVDEHGFVQSFVDTEQGRLLFLDTLAPGDHWGELCAKRLAWLEQRLEEAGDRPVFIFMHHPPFPVGIRLVDRLALRSAAAFADILRGRNVRHMFFGHLHRPIAGSWQGIPVSVVRSTVSQFALLLGTDQAARCYETPFYAVVLIDESQVIVHFHDYTYMGPMIPYAPVPAVIVDDENVAYRFQEARCRGPA